jgi:bifunctional N-acetylglucosamine-1-phosphate-uridyltransferase/glucosamine-1-phosphate-acetyltransferase GlmU-like protein
MTDDDELEDLLSTLYHALRAARRRYVIEILEMTTEEILTTRELARKTTSMELGVPERQATGEAYRNAYNALSQTHLPTLSEAGIIIYDPERQTVMPGVSFELAALLLDTNTPTVDVFASLLSGDEKL